MKLVRKIDYYCQLILGSLMLLSIPVLLSYGFLASLFILGCWQLLSAVFNTKAFIHTGHSKQISELLELVHCRSRHPFPNMVFRENI
jgi:hypothetical protein